MSEFNLVDEAWIPVRFRSGRHLSVGIRQALLESSEIVAIEAQSPFVVASLHRFLLAILYRSLHGPTDIDQARDFMRDGIPASRIGEYLDEWRHRFWLFDPANPFGQNPLMLDAGVEPWTKLAPEYNGTSSKVLFDHTDTRSPGHRSCAQCAQWIVASMTFSVSGGRGYYLSPEPNALFCIPTGTSLSQTLILNLIPYPNREVADGDSAQWEREPLPFPVPDGKRAANGYADLYTWQSRMILLQGTQAAGVAFMHFAAGVGHERSPGLIDPMQAYVEVKEKGRLPVRLRDGRDTWRDFASLLPAASGEGAGTVAHALRLTGRRGSGEMPSLLVVAQKNKPPSAVVDYWRMERFALPAELRCDRLLRAEIGVLLAEAESTEKQLWLACSSFGRHLLARGENRDADKKDVAAFIKHLSPANFYWSVLETRFHDILRDFATEQNHEVIARRWLMSVRDALRRSWAAVEQSIAGGDAWAIRAIAIGERPVREKLADLGRRIGNLDSAEVTL